MAVAPVEMPETKTRIHSASGIDERLRAILAPSRVLTRPIDRIAFASDASLYRLIPRAVVQPVDSGEVRKLFEFSRETKIPLTFRAGGTSLSGQAITDGILVDVGRYWRAGEVEEDGRLLRVQPGLIGQQANDLLRRYASKIGPDPASISAARMGGILSNNASGMCCAVAQNAYHTLRSLTFMLPSGTAIDSAAPDAEARFIEREPRLARGLLELKRQVENNAALAARISAKYRMKNTTGYSLNAFLDFATPVEIFSHLLVGAEGTLAFIAEAVLETIPDLPVKYTGLLLFPDLHAACAAIVPLHEAGAAALELMDRASLRSVEDKPGMPAEIRQLPDAAAALLVEFQTADLAGVEKNAARARSAVAGLDLLGPAVFTADPAEQRRLWNVRQGLFPSVGAVRASGTTVIIEDVAFPVERLADAAVDLTRLLEKHGYANAILFGHAKEGNLHFVITQGFDSNRKAAQYRDFIGDLVRLVVHKDDGALKAEHGTGRNMAPFVETEWGEDGYAIMRQLKALADPDNLLNPAVILNPDPAAHVKDLKRMPVVEEEIDKCIECGYCEPRCPSRELTLRPRQRIVVRREMQRLQDAEGERVAYDALNRDFPYMALDTCAVDGLCATACPVSIDTGNLTKRFRRLRHTAPAAARAKRAANSAAFKFFAIKTATRFCISRIMGALPGEDRETSVMQAMLQVAARAGVPLYVPQDIAGHCCGVPFSSKGFDAAHRAAVNQTIESLCRWSKSGALPVVVDTSPCAYGLKTARPQLNPENQFRFDKLTIMDSVEFVHDWLMPALPIRRKVHSVALHPVCSVVKMEWSRWSWFRSWCASPRRAARPRWFLATRDAAPSPGTAGFSFRSLRLQRHVSKRRRRRQERMTDTFPAAAHARSA